MSENDRDENYYELLEVNPNASFDEIADAYARICSYLGPESLAMYSMLDEDDIVDRRQRLERAYNTLSDPDLRAAYDDALGGNPRDAGYPAVMVPRAEHGADVTYGRVASKRARPSRDPEPAPAPESDASSTPASGEEPASSSEAVANADANADDAREEALPVEPTPEQPVSDEPVAAEPAATDSPAEPSVSSEPAVQSPPSQPESSPPNPGPPNSAPAGQDEPPPVPPRPILASEVRDRPVGATARGFRPPDRLRNISADQEISGTVLKRLRVACGVSISEVADVTKVSKRYLKALEENDFAALPAPVYVRGFVREYARVFGVDPDVVAAGYLALYRRFRGGE